MLVILPICMQETRNSYGLYGTFMSYSSLATKHDNTVTWPFLLSSDNTIKENSVSSTFGLHLQCSNNQDVKTFLYQLLMSIWFTSNDARESDASNITLVHKAFILLVYVQFRLPSVPREGGQMGEREKLPLFYLGKENAKTRPGPDTHLNLRYPKPALSVKIRYQNLHLRRRKKRMKKPCVAKTNLPQ